MSNRLQDLREERGRIVQAARELLDKATDEKRDLNDEESTKYDELIGKQDTLRTNIEREERQAELDRELAGRAAESAERAGAAPNEGEERAQRQLDGFRSWARGGSVDETPQEFRALQADSDTAGGYITAPQQVVQMLLKGVDDLVFMRQLGTVYQIPMSESLGVPTLDNDPADSNWTAEIATGSEDSTMSFGKRELRPHPLAKLLKVSKTLVRKGTMPVEQLVTARLAYKFGITAEKAYLTGSGSQQPLGVFTASSDGISTTQDVSSGNNETSIGMNGLITAKYTLKAAYWPRARWLFHRDAMAQISKLVDGQGQYLWRPSVRENEPDMLLGRPISMSEYAPNTFTSGLYVGMIADFSQYWIADSLAMEFQRLIELYAATNQIGFIGRLETDGMPVLEEAFVRVTLA